MNLCAKEYRAACQESEKVRNELTKKLKAERELKDKIVHQFLNTCVYDAKNQVVLKPDGKTPLLLTLTIEELDSSETCMVIQWPVKQIKDKKLCIEFDDALLKKLEKSVYFYETQELESCRHWELSPDQSSGYDKSDTNVIVFNNFFQVAIDFYERS
jgi:hypothetical protein